mmetsp:Transcript_25120/g.78209  ORF Transcript_25120/g.78209 Transcript_25120/m.78209 type:complete len:192 (-) Transcript_25120:12-587(-)
MHGRRSRSLAAAALLLTLAWAAVLDLCFASGRPKTPAVPCQVIARAAEASELPAEPTEAEEKLSRRNRIVGPDGKTGKQRRAARLRQRKKEAKVKEGPRELSITFGDDTGSPEAQVFYKGANKTWTHEAILEKFEEVGEVASLRFWLLGDESPMGMGVVGYKDAEAAQGAVEAFDGAEVGGRKLKVSLWKG